MVLNWSETDYVGQKPDYVVRSPWNPLTSVLYTYKVGGLEVKTKPHWIVSKSNHFRRLLDQFEYKNNLGNDFIKKLKPPTE